MKPHPKLRKTIKWGGAAVTVLLVVVWIGSGWWTFSYTTSHASVWVARGSVVVLQVDDTVPPRLQGWQAQPVTFSGLDRWRGYWNKVEVRKRPVFLPLWWSIPVPFFSSLLAWRLDALSRVSPPMPLCPRCGYDRTGLPLLAECPECGSGGVRRPLRRVMQRPGLNAVGLVLIVTVVLLLAAVARRWL